jgi:hypothetical protein
MSARRENESRILLKDTRAEQSISVDAGVDQRFASDRALIGFTYFYTHQPRVIDFQSFFVVDPLGLGRFSGYENRPGGFSRGVETLSKLSRGVELNYVVLHLHKWRSAGAVC